MLLAPRFPYYLAQVSGRRGRSESSLFRSKINVFSTSALGWPKAHQALFLLWFSIVFQWFFDCFGPPRAVRIITFPSKINVFRHLPLEGRRRTKPCFCYGFRLFFNGFSIVSGPRGRSESLLFQVKSMFFDICPWRAEGAPSLVF